MDAWMILELCFRFAVFKKIVTKPDLCEMSLIFVLGINLFNGIEHLTLEMEPFPNFRKSSFS
jgi:hypothetical protein